jgi:hypothetical protein
MKLYDSPGACPLGPHTVMRDGGLPNVGAFMARMAARQGVQAALKAEGPLK